MPRVTLTAAARREARGARLWLKEREPKTVEGFRNRLESARRTLSDFPLAGHESADGTRRLQLTPYPYYLVYRVLRDRVSVIAVAHSRQDEGFWLNR
jgi:plasmid stabilization system protein ParE